MLKNAQFRVLCYVTTQHKNNSTLKLTECFIIPEKEVPFSHNNDCMNNLMVMCVLLLTEY